MLKNQINHILLYGLLTTAPVIAMDLSLESTPENSPQKNSKNYTKKTLFNGYFTNVLPSNLPVYPYQKEKNLPKGASKITYETTEDNKTVRFSGKNHFNEDLEYKNEKYHIIIDAQHKDMFAIKMTRAESTESQQPSSSQSSETSSEETEKKGLELLKTKFGSSSNSDSEKGQSSKELSNSDSKKKQTPFHYLTSTHPEYMPNDIKIYEGIITKSNLQTSEITYLDENKTSQIIVVNNGSAAYPTFAMILDGQKQVKFAIKLPEQEVKRSIKSTAHKQAFTLNDKKPHNGYGLKHAFLGVTFIVFCVALAHRYNQLPDAFAQVLDNLCAQWDNLVISHFTR